MACVRAYVRRGLAANPQVETLHEGHELSWVALDALGLSSFELGSYTAVDETRAPEERSSQRCATETDPESAAMTSSLARKVVEVRKQMRQLVPWQDEYTTLSHQLADAITTTLQWVMADLRYFDFEEEKLVASVVAFERSTGGKFSSKVFTAEEYDEKREEREKSKGLRKEGKQSFRLNLGRRPQRMERPGARRATHHWRRTSNSRSPSATSAKGNTTSPRHPVTRQNAEADAKPLERGNWFWENRDVIEEAASDSDLNTPPGFSFYNFQESDEVFGASFTWQSEAMLSGPSVGNRRTGAKYSFLARCIFQNDHEEDEDADSESRFPGPQKSNQGDPEKQAWTTDVGSLAALLSLWMLTMEAKLGPASHLHASTRLLGCGWQVPVPADSKDKGILQWIGSIHSGSSGAGDDKGLGVEGMTGGSDDHSGEESGDTGKKTDGSDFSEPDEDSSLGESGADESGSLSVHHHSVLSKDPIPEYVRPYEKTDFYSVWIERKTPALTLPNFASYMRESRGHTFGTCFSSHSRFGPTSLDQQAYGNVLF